MKYYFILLGSISLQKWGIIRNYINPKSEEINYYFVVLFHGPYKSRQIIFISIFKIICK